VTGAVIVAEATDREGATMEGSEAQRMAAMTAAFFERAGDEPELSERMGFAQTTVHIHFEDADGSAGCTIWLDRSPIAAEVGIVGEAEIELFGPSRRFMGLVTGEEAMAIVIARGDITYTGPVRKFLRVVPILRSFDFEAFRGSVRPKDETIPADGSGSAA
jgi:hypothetical protein